MRLEKQVSSAASKLFQSTHPRGVRRGLFKPSPLIQGFQSTHPRGVRRNRKEIEYSFNEVSIHAPTRGATSRPGSGGILHKLFQSTHPRGVRPGRDAPMIWWIPFQSTHPRGVRHTMLLADQPEWISFNPRTHAGCDGRQEVEVEVLPCFNPRTHAGCDAEPGFWIPEHDVSIHAPTRGATKLCNASMFSPASFNPRTHAGCDNFFIQIIQYYACFNPRTHAGCD